jgi:uncharacterized protein (DUF433 family)
MTAKRRSEPKPVIESDPLFELIGIGASGIPGGISDQNMKLWLLGTQSGDERWMRRYCQMLNPEHDVSAPQITETAGVNGGFPVVSPTRIAVRLVIEAFREVGTLDRLADVFPQLTHAQLRVALDFYRDHPDRVDEDIERNARTFQAIRSRG